MPRRSTSSSSAKARADVFDALHKEMEIAEYATAPTGQRVRKVPRAQAPKRTAKRKALQREDLEEMTMEVEEEEHCDDGEESNLNDNTKRKKRLRGTRAAFEDVVLKSMPLGGGETSSAKRKDINNNGSKDDDEEEDEEEVQTESERYEMLQEVAALGIDVDMDGKNTNEDDEDEEDNEESGDDQDEEMGKNSNDSTTAMKQSATGSKPSTSAAAPKKKSKKNRVLHRMRGFSSQRLAQQHGEAISAHVRGMSDIAVEKLSQVAKAAPTAPQVYSSLGMVYESMLTEIEKELNSKIEGADLKDKSFVALVRRQLELARKTYGSYHVASLLCKRDFVLWERSGDAAVKVSCIYDDLIMMYKAEDFVNDADSDDDQAKKDDGFDPRAGAEQWRSDRKIWYEHALSAYEAADKLRPPGVDIPCKLAEAQMNLGNYIEALAILTDLRNKANGKSSQSGGMEESPPSWLLYADLMLKIGYECKKWNDSGSSSRQRNTFKRWLRKYSKSFDWKERRLQALCLALEAAAGSVACSELVEWMRKRAQTYIEKNEKEDADIDETATKAVDDDDKTENDANEGVDENCDAGVTVTSDVAEVLTYEQKRDVLVEQNKLELFEFDKLTKEMDLAETSPEYKDRVAARVELVETHRNKIKELALKQTQSDASKVDDTGIDPSGDGPPSTVLPIQSSCATIYEICRLLLSQCLHLGLYDGGVIVAQSALKYLQERVLRHEGKQKRQQNSIQLLGGGPQAGFAHDQMNDASDESDDDNSIIFLSDDEDLEEPANLQSLKSGVLPTDIKTMYSLCLLGNGGQDYVALNHLESILQSNQLEMFDEEDNPSDEGQGDEHNWIVFKKQFASPLGKTSMVAIIADVIKESPPGLSSRRILGIFSSYLKTIDHNDGLDDILSGPDSLLRANLLKILLASAKLTMRCDALEIKKLYQPGVNEAEVAKSVVADVVQTLTTLTRFQHVMWNPNNFGSLKGVSVETLSILCEALDVLAKTMTLVKDGVKSDTFDVAVMMSRYLVSTMFQAGSPPAKPGASIEHGTWKTFPLPNEWQTDFERKLSLKAYNLCVACCVSAFSGWETEEFSVDKLRSRDDDTNFFGVTFANRRVVGFLSEEIISSISQQWQRVQTLLPNLETLDFDTHLDRRKEAEWYQNILEKAAQQRGNVSTFGEDDGIKSLLSFSMLCLITADAKKNQHSQGDFLNLSMSILLPITQFIIDKDVWTSNIGAENKNEKDEVAYYLDKNYRWLGQTKATKVVQIQPVHRTVREPPQPPQQQRQKQKASSSLILKQPAPRIRPEISKLIKVPTSVLLDEWNKDESVKQTNAAQAERAMKKLDGAMKTLRKSRTLNALEQSSLDVSTALIDVAATEECYNPFLCLQQAAMYAELGSKLGSNDEPFKKCIPSKEKCTPLEALVILGRADCLRAIHFLQEAQYLCSWVISVCRLHRDRQETTFLWDDRWRVIGVLCYITKATIDQTGEALRNNNRSALTLRKWEDGAQEEANRGKSDAQILVGTDSDEVGSEIPQVEVAVDDSIPTPGNDLIMLNASQNEDVHGSQNENDFVAGPFDFNQLGELPVPVIEEDVQMGGEFSGIQVVGI